MKNVNVLNATHLITIVLIGSGNISSYVIDIETEKLDNPEKIWCVVLRNLDNDDVEVYRNCHVFNQELADKLASSSCLVGHNVINFDAPCLHSFSYRSTSKVIDTLIISRLVNYNLEGGHSLEAWGERFGVAKSKFSDYSQWSQELEDRCVIDTLLTKRLYNTLSTYLKSDKWKRPIELEHKVAQLCQELHSNGFSFNLPLAITFKDTLKHKVDTLSNTFREIFPPKSKLIRVINPVKTKTGTLHSKDFRWKDDKDLSAFSPEEPFSLFEYEEFNPASPKQIVERLNEAGWKPINKTKGHIAAERNRDKEKLKEYRIYGWKVDEENLATLPPSAPEGARKLAEWLLLNSRLSDLEEWIALYNPVSGRIHGQFNGIGSWTHRKSHQKPNMANIPALVNRKGQPQPWGAEFRSLFRAADGRILVGTDAEGIQLRLFAHYCNDQKLIKAIVEGKKEDKTDIHSLNKQILDTICNSREVAKTYIYALFLGAAKRKQAEILGCSEAEAEKGLQRILDYYPGWKELKETRILADAKKGYFEGLDGRLVYFPSAHHILAGYLQNGESVVMKEASLLWHSVLQKMRIPFWFVDDVHDEWQTETLPQYAETVGKIQAESIYIVGQRFKLNCPLAGSYKIGSNWKETH